MRSAAGKRHAGQVAPVLALPLQGVGLLAVARPQRDRVPLAGAQGQRRAPRAGAEHEQLHGRAARVRRR